MDAQLRKQINGACVLLRITNELETPENVFSKLWEVGIKIEFDYFLELYNLEKKDNFKIANQLFKK